MDVFSFFLSSLRRMCVSVCFSRNHRIMAHRTCLCVCPFRSVPTVGPMKPDPVQVEEPERCVYDMRFATPAVCREEHLLELRKQLEASEKDLQ